MLVLFCGPMEALTKQAFPINYTINQENYKHKQKLITQNNTIQASSAIHRSIQSDIMSMIMSHDASFQNLILVNGNLYI